MRKFAGMVLVFATYSLAGCASTQAFQKPTAADSQKALVYFIRKSCPPYLRQDDLLVDGKPVATLANNAYVTVNLPLGNHYVTLRDIDSHDLSFQLEAEPNQELYVVMTGDVKTLGTQLTGMNTLQVDLQWNFSAVTLSKEQGEAVIKSL